MLGPQCMELPGACVPRLGPRLLRLWTSWDIWAGLERREQEDRNGDMDSTRPHQAAGVASPLASLDRRFGCFCTHLFVVACARCQGENWLGCSMAQYVRGWGRCGFMPWCWAQVHGGCRAMAPRKTPFASGSEPCWCHSSLDRRAEAGRRGMRRCGWV